MVWLQHRKKGGPPTKASRSGAAPMDAAGPKLVLWWGDWRRWCRTFRRHGMVSKGLLAQAMGPQKDPQEVLFSDSASFLAKISCLRSSKINALSLELTGLLSWAGTCGLKRGPTVFPVKQIGNALRRLQLHLFGSQPHLQIRARSDSILQGSKPRSDSPIPCACWPLTRASVSAGISRV